MQGERVPSAGRCGGSVQEDVVAQCREMLWLSAMIYRVALWKDISLLSARRSNGSEQWVVLTQCKEMSWLSAEHFMAQCREML